MKKLKQQNHSRQSEATKEVQKMTENRNSSQKKKFITS